MPQLELLAMISAMVPSASKELVATRLTPVMLKNLWRDVYLAYLIKNYPDTELWRLGAEAMPNGQQFLDFQATDLVPYLANHSSNEAMYAREQVIRCTGAMGRVSAEPSFRHQGLLF